MKNKIRAYPMILLLLPLVAAILLCERAGVLYPKESVAYDSLYVHTFVIQSERKATARCERYEADTYGGRVYLYVARDSTRTLPQRGDTLIATTRIRHVDSIGNFDYRKYLLRQGIVGTAYVRKYELKSNNYELKAPLQKRLYERLGASGLSGDELATVGALTLGYKEDLDPDLRHRFQASGAAHVLAVSGLHTGIIYIILLTLITLGGRFRPLYEDHWGRVALGSVVIGVMWGYAWLTGMTPSVVRAVLMVSLVELGKMIHRNSPTLNTIASAAVLILLVRPLDLWSVSFQLSFAATAAIVLLASYTERFWHRKEWKHRWVGWIMNYITGILIVSIAAQLGTLPITMYTFGQVSTYFLLTNLMVLPIASFLVPCGLISLSLGGSTIGVLFSKVTWGLAWLMNHSVGWIESLPGSTVPAHINGWMIAIYYILLILFYVFVFKKDN